MRFFTSVYVIVTAKLVFSSECHEGYFSEEHNKCISCPEHCLYCNSSKSCLYCEDGYWGIICELPCSRCQPKTKCAKPNGFCIEKCKDGYTGSLCDAFCNDKCLNCDKMNASLCDLCALGRYGKSCDKRCPEFCYNNTCDNSGYCTHGCDSGNWGPKCGNSCSSNCKHSACDTQTGACTYGCKSNFVGSRCDNVNNEEGQTTPVILMVVAVLIVIVFVAVCVVYRKSLIRLINLRRRGSTRQAEAELPVDSPLTRVLTTSEDSGVCSEESLSASLTQDTVNLLQADTALNINNEPRNDQSEKIIIIHEIPADKIETDLSLTPGLLQQDKTATIEAPSIAGEISDSRSKKAVSPSVKNSTDNDSRAEARVSLESLKVRHFSDFSGTKAYIICKDPTKKSMTDSVFWKLVWQEGCSVIVKLSDATEGKPERKYWPEKNEECVYGDFIVFKEGEVLFDDYRRRTFTIKKDQKTKPRKVEQVEFMKWPIFKLPDDKSLINFRQEVNEERKTCHGPLLVHCRDGFCRSCVFVAMDILLGVLEKKDHADIGTILIELEDKGLITTSEHRKFLRKSWELFSTQMNTKEGLSAPPNKESPSLLITSDKVICRHVKK